MIELAETDAMREIGPDILFDKVTEEFYQDPLENFSKMFILDVDTVPDLYKSRYVALYNFFRNYNRSIIVGGSVLMKKADKKYDFKSLMQIARLSNPGINTYDFIPDIDIFTSETPLNLKMIFQHDLMRYLIERYLKNHSKVFRESKYFKENKTTGLLGVSDNFDSALKESNSKSFQLQHNMNNVYDEGSFSTDLFSMNVFMIQVSFFKLNIISTGINTTVPDFHNFTQNEISYLKEASHILKIMLDFDFLNAGLVYNPKTRNIAHVNSLFLKGYMQFKNTRELDSFKSLSTALEKAPDDFIGIYSYDLMHKLINAFDINSSLSTPKLIENFRVNDIFSSLSSQPLVKNDELINELINIYEEMDYNRLILGFLTVKRILTISKFISHTKTIFIDKEKYLNDPKLRDLTEEIIYKKISNLLNQVQDHKNIRRFPRVFKHRLTKYLNRGFRFKDNNGVISIINAFEKILNWSPKKMRQLEIKETLNKEYGVEILKEISDIFNRL